MGKSVQNRCTFMCYLLTGTQDLRRQSEECLISEHRPEIVADEEVLSHTTSIRKGKLVNEDPDFARKITEVACHHMQEKSCYML